MRSPIWYLNRARMMSPSELASRAVARVHDAQLGGRLAIGRPPRPRIPDVLACDGTRDPRFRVSDLDVGEWAQSERTDERLWRDRLIAYAEQVAHHRLSFFDLVDRDLGHPIDWNRDHATGQRSPLRFSPLIDYRDHRVTGDAKLVWEPNRHHHLVVLGRAYRATGELRFASAVVEQLESWFNQCPFGMGM